VNQRAPARRDSVLGHRLAGGGSRAAPRLSRAHAQGAGDLLRGRPCDPERRLRDRSEGDQHLELRLDRELGRKVEEALVACHVEEEGHPRRVGSERGVLGDSVDDRVDPLGRPATLEPELAQQVGGERDREETRVFGTLKRSCELAGPFPGALDRRAVVWGRLPTDELLQRAKVGTRCLEERLHFRQALISDASPGIFSARSDGRADGARSRAASCPEGAW
jgi:hypothetical protein